MTTKMRLTTAKRANYYNKDDYQDEANYYNKDEANNCKAC